jgi:hypothetical protein
VNNKIVEKIYFNAIFFHNGFIDADASVDNYSTRNKQILSLFKSLKENRKGYINLNNENNNNNNLINNNDINDNDLVNNNLDYNLFDEVDKKINKKREKFRLDNLNLEKIENKINHNDYIDNNNDINNIYNYNNYNKNDNYALENIECTKAKNLTQIEFAYNNKSISLGKFPQEIIKTNKKKIINDSINFDIEEEEKIQDQIPPFPENIINPKTNYIPINKDLRDLGFVENKNKEINSNINDIENYNEINDINKINNNNINNNLSNISLKNSILSLKENSFESKSNSINNSNNNKSFINSLNDSKNINKINDNINNISNFNEKSKSLNFNALNKRSNTYDDTTNRKNKNSLWKISKKLFEKKKVDKKEKKENEINNQIKEEKKIPKVLDNNIRDRILSNMKKYVIMKMSFEEILRKLIEFDKFKYIYFERSQMQMFNMLPNRPFDTIQMVESVDEELEDLKDWKRFWDINEFI